MSLNYVAIAVASVAEFIVGAIWYMPIFGETWGKIHGFNKLTKKEQKESQKAMGPLMAVQLAVTVITTIILAKFIQMIPGYSAYVLADFLWLGFVVPTQISAIVFGGTDPKWIVKKAVIMAGGSLACLMVAAAILTNM